MRFYGAFRAELETKIKTAMPFVKFQFSDSEASRFDWVGLIGSAELEPPIVIISLAAPEAQEHGLGNAMYELPAVLTLILDSIPVLTEVATTANSNTIVLADATDVEVGMRLFFDHTVAVRRQWAIVTAKASNTVTLDRVLDMTSGNQVYSTGTEVAEFFLQGLADLLFQDGEYFQLPFPAIIETSAALPANDIFLDRNAPYQAAAMQAIFLVGTKNN